MTYKQNENSKTPLTDSLENRNIRKKELSHENLHDLEIAHTTVNMTERYTKAHPNLSRLEPSNVKLHDVEIGHTAVNMTEQYIKAHPNDSKLESYKSILLSPSNQLIPMPASQCRHELASLYFLELLTKKRK